MRTRSHAAFLFAALIALFSLVQCQTSRYINDSDTLAESGTVEIPPLARKIATSGATLVLDASGYLYDPSDRSCDGFPRVKVETMPGTCLGLVLSRSDATDPATDKSFIKPRTIVQIAGTPNFLIADMGGWKPNNGRLFWLRRANTGRYELKLLKFPLKSPHGLALGPDGFYYIGESDKISRFKLTNGEVTDWRPMVTGLAAFEGHMHPLAQFSFNPSNGDLFINSGAPTDHCFVQTSGQYQSCPEDFDRGMGVILRVPGNILRNLPEGNTVRIAEVSARGLRNSMAMVVHPSGTLIQGENSRDFAELEEPYEEINVVEPVREIRQAGERIGDYRGYHHGWPYCYNERATSPEWIADPQNNSPSQSRVRAGFKQYIRCDAEDSTDFGSYRAPWALMPPHVAPLHMGYYNSNMFQDLFGGELLVSWHGYQPTGHRLVSYKVDEFGRPQRVIQRTNQTNATYNADTPPACSAPKAFRPTGGMRNHAPYREIISGWSEVKGTRPKGAPVGFTVAEDGSIWIVEDRESRVVLRLARTTTANYQDDCASARANTIDPKVSLLAWRHHLNSTPTSRAEYTEIQSKLITPYCLGCHGNMKANDIADDAFSNLDFIFKNGWVVPGRPTVSKFYGAIAHLESFTPMPPLDKPQFFGTPEGEQLNALVNRWVTGLPQNMDQRVARTTVPSDRYIRNLPTVDGSETCGQYKANDLVYVDPDARARVRASGWEWSKVYLVPGHTRLFPDKCRYPIDGVFYVALRRL